MLKVVLAGLLWLCATAAVAADNLQFGPPPAWVKPAAPMLHGPALEAGPAIRNLRLDRQLRLGPDGVSTYLERISQVRTALGLGALGTISLSWDPAHETVTVHRLRLIRGGAPIDLLAKQSFTVIRRETALELVVDGRLSATLQPEDLRVGDLVEFTYTSTRLDPVMQGRSEFRLDIPTADLATFRATWPATEAITWRAGSAIPKPKLSRHAGMVELTLEAKNLQTQNGPAGAPRRYWPTRELELTSFRAWSEVAALVAPLYERASTLSPDSPLRAEAAKIRALSQDPKVRAAAALKLVQDQVRYLGLVMTDGGYTPVDADKTWARRFGECKAKSALLVALLRALDIKAEPVLVSAYGGEGLDTRLPRMGAFDHVIVRAEIGGKTYWLDGTRMGDTTLDALDVPPHHFALPIRAEGSQLIALVRAPRERPDAETILELDASAGIHAPAPVRGQMLMSGDRAFFSRALAANLPAADREKMLKTMWSSFPWIDVAKVEIKQDAAGESRIFMEGKARIPWTPAPNGGNWFIIRQTQLGSAAEFKRDPGPNDDAPFSVAFPSYSAFRLTMKLPVAGGGFSVHAATAGSAFAGRPVFSTQTADLDLTVAGRAYRRSGRIENGVVAVESSSRALAPEFPASEAAAAGKALTEMAKASVVVHAPMDYRLTEPDVAAFLASKPSTANEWVSRGARLMVARRPVEALADFDKALTLEPNSALALASRGLAYLATGRLDRAKADLQQAERLDSRIGPIQSGLGKIAMIEGRHSDAVAMFSREVDLSLFSPDSALVQRAAAYRAMGQAGKAIADLDEVLKRTPDFFLAHIEKANIYLQAGDRARALEAVDAGLKVISSDPRLHTLRGGLLAMLGRRQESMAAFERSIAIEPTAEAYLTRAKYRDAADQAGKFADLDAAEKLEPGDPTPNLMRAEALAEAGEHDKAIEILSRALKAYPAAPPLLAERASAYFRSGRTELAARDFGLIRKQLTDSNAGEASLLNLLCWTQATLGMALETALADCLGALKLEPGAAAILDSKAFVLLRLKRFGESVENYDLAVKLRPLQADSLYGRGLAKLGLGQSDAGQADLAAARKISDRIDAQFARYGLKP